MHNKIESLIERSGCLSSISRLAYVMRFLYYLGPSYYLMRFGEPNSMPITDITEPIEPEIITLLNDSRIEKIARNKANHFKNNPEIVDALAKALRLSYIEKITDVGVVDISYQVLPNENLEDLSRLGYFQSSLPVLEPYWLKIVPINDETSPYVVTVACASRFRIPHNRAIVAPTFTLHVHAEIEVPLLRN